MQYVDEDKQMEKVSVNFDNSSRIDVYVFFMIRFSWNFYRLEIEETKMANKEKNKY